MYTTPTHFLKLIKDNNIWIKREDLIPISFGGNKARKAILFFQEIDCGKYDCVVTYGSSSSNHCRIVANMAAMRGISCYIISPQEASEPTYNSYMMKMFNAHIKVVKVANVHSAIESTLSKLRNEGLNPYFIAGGGHGNIGTQAYVECYKEIKQFELENGMNFDYIFHASGTGTTQAGLVCGQIINRDYDKTIVGISIARKSLRGRIVVLDSIQEYLSKNNIAFDKNVIENLTIFDDSYTDTGYGAANLFIKEMVDEVMIESAVPMDLIYTGKAYAGMNEYLKKNGIDKKNILFIHTGGTPLFFDYLKQKYCEDML